MSPGKLLSLVNRVISKPESSADRMKVKRPHAIAFYPEDPSRKELLFSEALSRSANRMSDMVTYWEGVSNGELPDIFAPVVDTAIP